MGEKAASVVKTQGFSGMVSGVSPHDLPEGAAALLLNVMILRPGELRVRRGLQELRFDEESE